MGMRRSGKSADDEMIAEIRHFNRSYTRQLGLLDSHLLGSPFTLTEVRVLYELARGEATTASAIAAELGLDLGYLSRILKMFERRRYIRRERSSTDARQATIRLTPLGRRQFLPLDAAARSQIVQLVKPLSDDGRRRLVDSMRAVQDLLAPSGGEQRPYRLRGLRPGDVGWIVHRQAMLYHREYGWDGSYEALVAEILGRFVQTFDATHEQAWIAERDGHVVGSVFLVIASDSVAQLRLLYVEPEARGLGIGRRLVDECIAFARARGYERLTLWTNDVLVSARRIYEAAGFRLTDEKRHHSFGKDLVGQTWEMTLGIAVSSVDAAGASE